MREVKKKRKGRKQGEAESQKLIARASQKETRPERVPHGWGQLGNRYQKDSYQIILVII